jgi:hypothetical protein
VRIVQEITKNNLSDVQLAALRAINPQLLFAFWSRAPLGEPAFVDALRTALPDTALVGCSTAGEIAGEGVHENSCLLTAVRFDSSRIDVVETTLADMADSYAAGARLAAALPPQGLRGVFLLGPGIDINGSALIDGLDGGIAAELPISGGLAADNGAFQQTHVLTPQGIGPDKIVAVGFYGERFAFGAGCKGGWSAFGPTRRITRAEGSCLYELDGQPALDLYKRYLGDYASELPAAGLLFPFEMLDDERKSIGLLRTILGIDETTQSLLLAGSVNTGSYLRLMHATTDALVDGAENAAADSLNTSRGRSGLALLVSCVGRKLVMGDRVDEEVLAVAEQLGSGFTLTGFYSNGEVSPLRGLLDCKLHNQTMTIALLSEL